MAKDLDRLPTKTGSSEFHRRHFTRARAGGNSAHLSDNGMANRWRAFEGGERASFRFVECQRESEVASALTKPLYSILSLGSRHCQNPMVLMDGSCSRFCAEAGTADYFQDRQ